MDRRLHSEKYARPRKEKAERAAGSRSSRRQAERGGKVIWNATQSNHYLASGWRAGIASQPFGPREPIMSTLRTGKGHRFDGEAGGSGGSDLDRNILLTHQLDAHPSVLPPTPVAPEQGRRTDAEGMQQHTHLSRFGGGAAIPLTLLTQGARTTTADAGRIHHTQTPIGLSAPLVCHKRLANWTA